MSGIPEIFLRVCLPLLLVIGLGWLLDRRFGLDLRTLVKLNIYLFVPAFILVRLSTSTSPDGTAILVIVFTLLVILSMGLLSWAASRFRGDSPAERAGMQLGTMIYNSGNWGLPLMTLAFSEPGGVVQVFVLATMNVSNFTIGVLLANASREHPAGGWRTLLPVLRQPSIYAVIVAVSFRVLGNPLLDADFIWIPLTYLADALVGFALLTLGVQLSQTRPPTPTGRLGWALGIRLLGGPLIAIALTRLLGIEGLLAAILILGSASPTAVNTALLAHELGADSRFAAAVVFYSTLAATGIVTLLLALLHAGAIPWAVPVGLAPGAAPP